MRKYKNYLMVSIIFLGVVFVGLLIERRVFVFSPTVSDETVDVSVDLCGDLPDLKSGSIGKYKSILRDLEGKGYEAVATKEFDGTKTSLLVTTNRLPDPVGNYIVWLYLEEQGEKCGWVNLGTMKLDPKPEVYILSKTGPGSFDDRYRIAISDDVEANGLPEHLILEGSFL